MRRGSILAVVVTCGLLSVGCIGTRVTNYGSPVPVPVPVQEHVEPYNGPKARIAVSRFKDKTGKGKLTGDIGDGMADMLATALFHTNRFIVLERAIIQDILTEQDMVTEDRIKQETGVPPGEIEGAELQVTGAVTEFEPGSAGISGRITGGKITDIIGGIISSVRKSHVALEIRVVDTRTSRIVAAVSVEGEATDFSLGGFLVGRDAGGSLGGWVKTPIEKAIRIAIQEAVHFIVQQTPQQYFRHGAALSQMHKPERDKLVAQQPLADK